MRLATNPSLRNTILKSPAGIKRLIHSLGLIIDISVVFQQTKMCFQVLLKGPCFKIRKQIRTDIPSPNPLLPLSNYSLAADKLQVCLLCLSSSDTTGEVRPVCTGLDSTLLLVLLAKYILPFLVQQ